MGLLMVYCGSRGYEVDLVNQLIIPESYKPLEPRQGEPRQPLEGPIINHKKPHKAHYPGAPNSPN